MRWTGPLLVVAAMLAIGVVDGRADEGPRAGVVDGDTVGAGRERARALAAAGKHCEAAAEMQSAFRAARLGAPDDVHAVAGESLGAWMRCARAEAEAEEAAELERRRALRTGRAADSVARRGGVWSGWRGDGRRGAELEPQPIPPERQALLVALDELAALVPPLSEVAAIRYRRARIYYELNHFAEALPIFRDIVEHHRDGELALYAANLAFDCDNVLGRFDDLERDVRRYCAFSELVKDAEFQGQCDRIFDGMALKEIGKLEREGQYLAAADRHVEMATVGPRPVRVAEHLHAAAVDYEQAHELALAIATRERLIAAGDAHEAGLLPYAQLSDPRALAKRAIYELARNWMSIAEYDKAAELFERFASRFPGEAGPMDAREGLATAVGLRVALGDAARALRDVDDFTRTYSTRSAANRAQAARLAFGLHRLYATAGDDAKLEQHLRGYLKDWQDRGPPALTVRARVMLGDLLWARSCPVAGVDGLCVVPKAPPRPAPPSSRKPAPFVMPLRCSEGPTPTLVLRTRRARAAGEALQLYAAALAPPAAPPAATGRSSFGGAPPRDEPPSLTARAEALAAVESAARAHFVLGDAEHEKMLGRAPPALGHPSSFDADLARWTAGQAVAIEAAAAHYRAAAALERPSSTIAAEARLGQLYDHADTQLTNLPLPPPPPTPTGMSQREYRQAVADAFCEAVWGRAEPLDRAAAPHYAACTSTARNTATPSEWIPICESGWRRTSNVDGDPGPSEILPAPNH